MKTFPQAPRILQSLGTMLPIHSDKISLGGQTVPHVVQNTKFPNIRPMPRIHNTDDCKESDEISCKMKYNEEK